MGAGISAFAVVFSVYGDELANAGGMLEREGHTEAAVDLAELAGAIRPEYSASS